MVASLTPNVISYFLFHRKRLTAKQCLHHKWLAQHDKTMSCVKLCTDKLKKFIIRRKWQVRQCVAYKKYFDLFNMTIDINHLLSD